METIILQQTSDLKEGDHIDEYVLLECVQVGGEGALWTAKHQTNHQIVIIKFVSKPDWHSLELFELDRSSIVGLDHPNIREVFHSGVFNEIPFTCMRFYPSGSVQGLIDERNLSVQETLIIAAQITSALDYIHSQRIVHRDLKPTNLLLDSQLHVYLTDFGLARQVSESTRLFHTGHGSAPYSPPEQHTREEITLRSDIYSFGIVLYRLLSGELPWEGKIALAIKQLENNTPLPNEPFIASGLPESLVDGLRILTERDPEKRPNSAIEGFGLIASILDGHECEPVSYETGKKYLDKYLQMVPIYSDDSEFEIQETKKILERSSELWEMGNRGFDLSMTEFSFIDSIISKHGNELFELSESQNQMMSFGAIKYSINQGEWWKCQKSNESKVDLVDLIIHQESATAIQRCLDLIQRFDQDLFSGEDIFASLILSLLEVMKKIPGEIIGADALKILELLAKPGKEWHDSLLPDSAVDQLAKITLAEKQYSTEAAKLIGTLRLSRAVEVIWQSYKEEKTPHTLEMLILIYQIAGGVPRFVPWNFRINLFGHVALEQMASQRNQYFRSFLLIALCVAVGVGYYVFVSFRMPSIFNTARVLSTLGSGLLIGPILGSGIFATDSIVSQLEILRKTPRILLGSFLGTVFITLGFVTFHTLFLDNPPSGSMIVAGSFVIAFGASIGSILTGSLAIRLAIGFTFSCLALFGSGYLSDGTEQTPLLYYDLSQTYATILNIAVTSLFFGLANIVTRLFKKVE